MPLPKRYNRNGNTGSTYLPNEVVRPPPGGFSNHSKATGYISSATANPQATSTRAEASLQGSISTPAK